MPSKQELHVELDRLLGEASGYRTKRRDLSLAGHALIELGLLNSMTCAYEECIMDTKEFEPFVQGKQRMRLTMSLDHVIPIFMGGTDMPDNLRMLHFGCNSSRGAKHAWGDPVIRQRLTGLTSERWKDPEYRAIMSAAGSSVEKSEKQRMSMKKYWSDPDLRAKRGASMTGDNHWRAKRRAAQEGSDQ